MKSYTNYSSDSSFIRNSLLLSLDIELTERCNNSCLHCCINLPVDDIASKRNELSTDKIKTILDQAAELGCIKIRYTGGEPLLRPDFEQIYEYTRRLGMRVQLFTNARLITPRLAELFSQIPPLEKIEVSVYGMSPSSYDQNTQQVGAYKSFNRGIELLVKYKIPFVIKSVILPSSINEIEKLDDWAKTIKWMDGKQPTITQFFDYRLRRDDVEKNSRIEALRVSPKEGVMFLLARYNKEYKEIKKKIYKQSKRSPNNHLFGCSAGVKQLTIDSYGRIQACLLLRTPEFVLSTDHTLKQALDYYKKLSDVTTLNPEYLEKCGRCFLRNLCEQCPAKSWSEFGVLDQPIDYLCKITHELARHLGLLAGGQKTWDVEGDLLSE